MSDEKTEQAIKFTTASVIIKGFQIDLRCVTLCRKLLKNEITMNEYISAVTEKKTI